MKVTNLFRLVTVLTAALEMTAFAVIGYRIHCNATSAREGQSASISCHFKHDLKKETRDFTVQHSNQQGQLSEILSCLWISAERPTCTIAPGFTFDEQISSNFTLTIPSPAQQHVGMYMCLTIPSNIAESQPCNFTLGSHTEVPNFTPGHTTDSTDNNDDGNEEGQTEGAYFTSRQTTDSFEGNSDDGKGNHVTVIAIVIPVLLVVICLVVVFVCRKRLTEHWRNGVIGERRKTNECNEENDLTQSQPFVTIEDSMSPTTTQPSDQPVDQVVSPDSFSGSEVIIETESTKTTGESRQIPASQDKTTRAKSPEVTGKTKEKPFSGYLYNRAVRLLEKTGAIVIIGPEKCGKSVLGMHVFDYFMEKGLVPLALGDLSQWREKKQDDKDRIVLLDELKIDEGSAKTLSSMLLDEHCYIIFIVQSDAKNKESRDSNIPVCLRSLPVIKFVEKVPTDTKRLNQLFEACHNDDVEQVVTLLSGGIDPNRFDGKGRTSLHIACEHGHVDIVSDLLWAGCRVNTQDKQMRTPLHIACEHGHARIVSKLISAGCDVNSRGINDCTPLHIACEHGHVNIVTNLLSTKCDVNARDKTKSTPLHYACNNPKQSRDDDAANDDEDPSPRPESYESPRETIVKSLLPSGASLNTADNKDRTPLPLARESNNCAMVRILLKGGADVEAKDKKCQTPLHVACQYNNRAIVKSLIGAKSDVNAKDNDGRTPLHLACAKKANDSVEMLLNANASVHERTDGDMTPLHCACFAGSNEIIQMLLNKGADIHVIDNHGRTPESVARSKGHLDIIYLVSTAADETPSQTSVNLDQQFPFDFDHFI